MCAPTGFSSSAVVAACAASIALFVVLWHAASQSPSWMAHGMFVFSDRRLPHNGVDHIVPGNWILQITPASQVFGGPSVGGSGFEDVVGGASIYVSMFIFGYYHSVWERVVQNPQVRQACTLNRRDFYFELPLLSPI